MITYPLGDRPRGVLHTKRNIRAVATGEFRPPKAGEWYLSGAIVAAYRAPNDLDTNYHIARLVVAEEKTVTTVVAAYVEPKHE